MKAYMLSRFCSILSMISKTLSHIYPSHLRPNPIRAIWHGIRPFRINLPTHFAFAPVGGLFQFFLFHCHKVNMMEDSAYKIVILKKEFF